MKIVPNRLFTLVALVFPIADALAEAPPPPSMPPPPPPGLPLDGGLVLLFVAAVTFGIYTLYTHYKKTPAK